MKIYDVDYRVEIKRRKTTGKPSDRIGRGRERRRRTKEDHETCDGP